MLPSLDSAALRADQALAVARDTFLRGVTGGIAFMDICFSCRLYKLCVYEPRWGRLCGECHVAAVVDGVTVRGEAERDERMHKAAEPARVRRV